MKNFIIGTANFGNLYGEFNPGVVSENKIKNILNFAQKNDIYCFDTAKSYKNSEAILGKYLDRSKSIKIDTKIGAFGCQSVEQIIISVRKSIDLLGVSKISTLYLHDSNLILGQHCDTVKRGLKEVKDLGLVEHLGVSVYTREELLQCKVQFREFTHFQILENVCDRRLRDSDALIALAEMGNKINVRSIFLQGLLLSNPKKLNGKFLLAKKSLVELNDFAYRNNVSVFQLCVAYAQTLKWVNQIVVGVESKSQLEQILNSSFQLPVGWQEQINTLPESLLDPRYW
jgi:aryl-alcohol dehydrogenase-like predicted oxidoreductase